MCLNNIRHPICLAQALYLSKNLSPLLSCLILKDVQSGVMSLLLGGETEALEKGGDLALRRSKNPAPSDCQPGGFSHSSDCIKSLHFSVANAWIYETLALPLSQLSTKGLVLDIIAGSLSFIYASKMC